MVVLLALVIAIYSVIRDPRIQTLGIRMTAAYFSQAWNTEVMVGGFGFSITNGLTLDEIMVKDQRDTVLFATHHLAVQPDLKQPRPPAHVEWPRWPGLHVASGYGARGFVWAPLMAELLASQILGDPMPIENELAAAVDPARFGWKGIQ